MQCWKTIDPEKSNAIGMEAIVAKLSGFAKFEVKTKLNQKNFEAIIQALSAANSEDEEAVIIAARSAAKNNERWAQP